MEKVQQAAKEATKGTGGVWQPRDSEAWTGSATVTLVNARFREEDNVKLHRAVNDLGLLRDWLPLRAYCFRPSVDPATSPADLSASATEVPPHLRQVAIFILKVGQSQEVAAGAGVLPMTQNVRGAIFPMGGMRGVSSFPEGRRKGYVSAVMTAALSFMHDNAIPLSTLYPFKASFYERMGYVCVGSKRQIVFSPGVFSGLRPAPELRMERKRAIDFDKEEYVQLLTRMQKKTHGFARYADPTLEKHMDWSEKIIPHWVVVVRDHKGISGVLGYRLGPFFSGTMNVDVFAYANIATRTALLSWIGSHVDQAKAVSLVISPEEDFENWVADASFHVSSVEIQKPQMARIVSVQHLAGMPVGGHDALQLDFTLLDPFLAINHRQRFRLGVNRGLLTVQHRTEQHSSSDGLNASVQEVEPEIDIRGLTALVFGVVRESADELESRGWASFPQAHKEQAKAARRAVKTLFPPTPKPLLYENF